MSLRHVRTAYSKHKDILPFSDLVTDYLETRNLILYLADESHKKQTCTMKNAWAFFVLTVKSILFIAYSTFKEQRLSFKATGTFIFLVSKNKH